MITGRLDTVDKIFNNPDFDAALWELQGAQVRQDRFEARLFELMIENRKSDDTALTDTTDSVSDLLTLIHVTGDTATIHDCDISAFMDPSEVDVFWAEHNAAIATDNARETAIIAGSDITEDSLVRWGLIRSLKSTGLIRTVRSELKTAVTKTVGALDRTDMVLRQHHNEPITHLSMSGYISTSISDGLGLRIDTRDSRYAQLSSNPTYSIRAFEYPSNSTPHLFVDIDARDTSMVDVSRQGLPIVAWQAILRSSTWSTRMPKLFFGEPVEGPLCVEDSIRQQDLDVLHENLRYYESGVSRSRLVAGLAMGNVTLEEIERQGVTVVHTATTPKTS